MKCGPDIPTIDGDECDALSRKSRKLLCVFRKPGVARFAKRKYQRRSRRIARHQLLNYELVEAVELRTEYENIP